jgi:hypothetical protein
MSFEMITSSKIAKLISEDDSKRSGDTTAANNEIYCFLHVDFMQTCSNEKVQRAIYENLQRPRNALAANLTWPQPEPAM